MSHIPVFAFMSFTLSLAESVFLLLALLVAAVGISLWVYRHTVPEVSKGVRATLVTFRSLALAVLLFILFQPVLNLEETVSIDPKVAVLFDDSKSMTVADKQGVRIEILKQLSESGEFSNLEKADIRYYRMGPGGYPLQRYSADSLTGSFAETDIGSALQKVHDDLKEQNLKAVVLATDGAFTSGKNPLYTAEAIGAPVYTIGIGDSTEKKDVLVGNILANAIAYVDNSVPVEVSVRSAGYDQGTVRVTLAEGGATVDTKEIQLQTGANEYKTEFQYVPKSEGTKKLTVSISSMPGELTEKNNRRSFFMKVLKTKMKVAVIAGAPSPDVSFMKQAFSKDKNVDATFYVQKTASAWFGAAPARNALTEADCIFLVGFPLTNSPSAVLQSVKAAAEEKNKPLFILLSRTSDVNRLQGELGALMPLQTLQVRSNENEVFVQPAGEASQNPVLRTGIATDAWQKLPPLFKTESSFKAKPGTAVLATMKINTVAFNEPVLVSRNLNRKRVVMSTAYGLWRWQLAYDVMEGRLPEMLVSNSLRWLTSSDDDQRVRIAPVKEFFDSSEPVEFQGQVYDESYEPVSNATVTVAVKSAAGERELTLDPLGNGFYAGKLEQLGEGDYSYTGSASVDGTTIGADKGRFSVGELNLEFVDTRMNSALLRQIASRTKGAYFPASDISGLSDAVFSSPEFKPDESIIKDDIQLWNLLPLLLLAVLFFAIEWYIRKQSGMV